MKLKKFATVLAAAVLAAKSVPVTAFAADGVAVDEAHFPDAIFRAYVSENCDTDKDGVLSDEEIAAVTWIELSVSIDATENLITTFKGVEYFTALTNLHVAGNPIKELDVSKNTALTKLGCEFCELSSLDVSKNTALTKLECYHNNISKLDLSNNKSLTRLVCHDNQLEELDLSNNAELHDVFCEGNKLTELNISANKYLIYVYQKDEPSVGGNGQIQYEIGYENTGSVCRLSVDKAVKIITEAAAQPEQKPEQKPETKPEEKPETKPEEKPVTTPEENKPEEKPEQKPADDSNKPTGASAGIAFAGIALAGAAIAVSKKRK